MAVGWGVGGGGHFTQPLPPSLSQHPASVPSVPQEKGKERAGGGRGWCWRECVLQCVFGGMGGGVGGDYTVVLFPTALILFSPAEGRKDGREWGPCVKTAVFF